MSPVIDKLIEYCTNQQWEETFEKFFAANCEVFTDDEEQKLEYMQIFNAFTALFESQLEGPHPRVNAFLHVPARSRRAQLQAAAQHFVRPKESQQNSWWTSAARLKRTRSSATACSSPSFSHKVCPQPSSQLIPPQLSCLYACISRLRRLSVLDEGPQGVSWRRVTGRTNWT